MKAVVVAPEAEAQLRTIHDWWSANRPQAPNLFLDEIAASFELLRHFADAGQRVPNENRGL